MFKATILFSVLAYTSLSFAGGPAVLEGPNGNTPVRYQNPNITVHLESGDLGTLSNTAADILVQEAFDLWSQVNTSTINFNSDQTQLNLDININNYNQYWSITDDNLNPLIYDNNGEIIDDLLGVGQSDDIVGIAASAFTVGGDYFVEGRAVINGKNLGLTNTILKLIIIHEIAHLFGLDHSQVNINNKETAPGFPGFCSTSIPENYPVMYPIINCRNLTSLHSDDISAVSALYPEANINDNFGIVEGRFVDESGNAILGANIWAENIATGESYSVVSDYLKQGTGYYKLYLPAATYTLHANSVNPEFYSGSGIGPYSATITDISFTAPHPITTVTYQGDSVGSDEVITASANQTLEIIFSISGINATIPVTSSADDDDSFSDLFGAISFKTILLILFIAISGRRLGRRFRTMN